MTARTRTILHISTRLILGGSQENTVLSCEGQVGLGHDVHLAFGPIYGPEGSLLDRARSFRAHAKDARPPRGITTHELPNLIRAIHPVRDHVCYHHELKGLIRRVKPDIVHTHSSKAGVLGRAAAWSLRKRQFRETGRPMAVIHTIHGPPFHELLGPFTNTTYTLAERFAAGRCHTIACVADAMRRQFLERRIGRPAQYVTVRSGMETGGFLIDDETAAAEARAEARAELGVADNEFVIGTVARLAEHKGHDDLIDALARDVKDRAHADRPWRLLWVGDGWWRDRLTARLDAAGIADRVTLTGLVPQERVARMMRAMDALVHPSHREGLPRTVPQGLLTGLPVVASDVDGTREACVDPAYLAGLGVTPDGAGAITPERTGRLFARGDVQAIRDAVRWVFERSQEAAVMAGAGRAVCRKVFSAHSMVDHLEEIYEHALGLAAAEMRGRAG